MSARSRYIVGAVIVLGLLGLPSAVVSYGVATAQQLGTGAKLGVWTLLWGVWLYGAYLFHNKLPPQGGSMAAPLDRSKRSSAAGQMLLSLAADSSARVDERHDAILELSDQAGHALWIIWKRQGKRAPPDIVARMSEPARKFFE